MRQELRNAFGKEFISVTVDKENRWVHTIWKGYLTQENIKAGALAYTNAVKEAGYNSVLNDTRQILGGWDHSLDWVVNEWGPQAARVGIRHFAMVVSPASFAQTTADTFFATLKAFEVKVFDNTLSAEAWLRQYSVKK